MSVKSDKYYAKVRSVFDTFAREQKGYYDASHRGWVKHHTIWQYLNRRSINSIFNNHLLHTKDLKFLDVGCGRGDFTCRLHRQFEFNSTLGIDFSKLMLEIADEQYQNIPGLSFALMNITEYLSFKNKSFDVSLCLNTLHHLLPSDQEKLIRELCRVTKSMVVMEIKRIHFLWHLSGGYQAFGHLRFYPTNVKEVENVFRACGYHLKGIRPLFFSLALSPIALLVFSPDDRLDQTGE